MPNASSRRSRTAPVASRHLTTIRYRLGRSKCHSCGSGTARSSADDRRPRGAVDRAAGARHRAARGVERLRVDGEAIARGEPLEEDARRHGRPARVQPRPDLLAADRRALLGHEGDVAHDAAVVPPVVPDVAACPSASSPSPGSWRGPAGCRSSTATSPPAPRAFVTSANQAVCPPSCSPTELAVHEDAGAVERRRRSAARAGDRAARAARRASSSTTRGPRARRAGRRPRCAARPPSRRRPARRGPSRPHPRCRRRSGTARGRRGRRACRRAPGPRPARRGAGRAGKGARGVTGRPGRPGRPGPSGPRASGCSPARSPAAGPRRCAGTLP